MSEFAAVRHNMVECQLRPNKVTNWRLIDAMDDVPRERFVPKQLAGVAYIDEDLMVAPGRYLMEPRVLARLLQAATITEQDVALDVGCGTGYSSAVLGRLAGTVVGLEPDDALAAQASQTLSAVGADNVIVVTGSVAEGYSRQGPYDVILLNGSIPFMPSSLIDQLAEGGRIIAVVRGAGEVVGRATLWVRIRGEISHRVLFDAAVPPLPGIETKPAFEF
ncbi:MAG: protein-L-isoaspartate O-methyltransferase [Proteobacteria bacterium]|nr:protein-L-isoaspartate O-methyltransferase [Pseudomonadota bacterium]MDA1356696.1 protein-L-isoaspartate O-methyltransferase [Pseudomonadota bacterium]